jgi:hypothetical protein
MECGGLPPLSVNDEAQSASKLAHSRAAGWNWRRVLIWVPLALPVPDRRGALAKPVALGDQITLDEVERIVI